MLSLTPRALWLSSALALTPALAPPVAAQEEVTIGFSQASSNSAHRNTMTLRNQEYAAQNLPDATLIVTNAEGSTAKQITDVESLLVQGIDALMISPQDSDALTPVVGQVIAAGIPVVTLERSVGVPVTAHIGPMNEPIGRLAGEFLVERLGGTGNVVEILGDPAVSAAVERHAGFAAAIEGSGLTVVAEQNADWDQEQALRFMEDTLQRFPPGEIQAVFAHNDNMAFGALRAIQAAGRQDEGILIVGIDGENLAIRSVANGELAATFTYSTVAPEGVIAAYALAKDDTAALSELGTVTAAADGSLSVEIPSEMITQENAAQFFCQGFGDDPECP